MTGGWFTRWGPSLLAKLVYKSNNVWFRGDISIVDGVYKPTFNWGAQSCMIGLTALTEVHGGFSGI